MTQVNLLPWREQARQAKKMRFLLVIGLFVGLAVLMEIFLHFFMLSMINNQLRVNSYLQVQLDQEQKIVVQLNNKKKEGGVIYAKLKFIYLLQNESYRAVKLLDALPRVLPDGVSLIKLTREGVNITLAGRAKSNLQVSVLMENIAKNPIFNQPVLTEISGKESATGDEKLFQIKIVQKD